MNQAKHSPGVEPGFDSPETQKKDGLTGIPRRIHCTATDESGGSENDELDRIDIENFLDAFAQVALSVATRRASKGQGEDS